MSTELCVKSSPNGSNTGECGKIAAAGAGNLEPVVVIALSKSIDFLRALGPVANFPGGRERYASLAGN